MPTTKQALSDAYQHLHLGADERKRIGGDLRRRRRGDGARQHDGRRRRRWRRRGGVERRGGAHALHGERAQRVVDRQIDASKRNDADPRRCTSHQVSSDVVFSSFDECVRSPVRPR